MDILQNWFPPSRENWELLTWAWQFFPLVTVIQWLTDFYPQGKTSIESRFNVPGKIGWVTMEIPGPLTLMYTMWILPPRLEIAQSLPWSNWILAGMFLVHYSYRAVLAPLVLNPSMSPMHPLVWVSGLSFQIINCLSIGGWLAGYGPTGEEYWAGRSGWFQLGAVIWAAGLLGNIYHDDLLREVRRAAMREQRQREKEQGETGKPRGVDKVYKMPQDSLFRFILFPHYVCEWIEWTGYWIMGGRRFVPARNFLVNEVATMTPRAVSGKRWYVNRLGRKAVGRRTAVVPGLI
ncbi:MAG: hypothetical protein M1815_002098 [Lichina confinis]|nr:MAG: hypothetical protein M1815_002098 [Lichina confinis]